jgi:hypothetical protein
MPEFRFGGYLDGVPSDLKPGDARVGAALAAAPVPLSGEVRTVADVLSNVPQNRHRLIDDADYQCLSSDVQIGMKPLTAPRTIYLPDVDAFPFQDLVIADESGACSEALTITILPGPDTSDTIAGSSSILLTDPYQAVRFRRGAANLWIRT